MFDNGLKKSFNRIMLIGILLSLAIPMCACGKKVAMTRALFAMDTFMTYTINDGDEAMAEEVESIINEIENLISTTKSESQIYKLNLNGCVDADDMVIDILSEAFKYEEMTDGVIDISIYPVVSEWGFTTGEYKVPSQQKLDELLENVDYKRITVDGNKISLAPNMKVDLGCIGKGYTGDQIVKKLRDYGVESAIISLGGNVQTMGKNGNKPWKVAIADPLGKSQFIGAVSVENQAVVTSGGYERFFEEAGRKYHHIINPVTGKPADNDILAVSVVGPSGTACDALSTALFIMGLDKASAFWRENNDKLSDTDFLIVDKDGIIHITEGLKANFEPMSTMTVEVISR